MSSSVARRPPSPCSPPPPTPPPSCDPPLVQHLLSQNAPRAAARLSTAHGGGSAPSEAAHPAQDDYT
eukprot:6970977-Prymnesium_polylepis.1